jgi:MFS family permease
MKQVAVACFVGSTIEYYDFFIYATAAALVFPSVFFPHLGPAMATTASMGTFATAFLARPLGAIAFGYFGDRLGRKKTLVATLLIMGTSTVSVGLVPSTAAIGVAAPLILTTLRLLQGFSVGGEWAGSALLSAEYAPATKRGRYGMFTLVGSDTGTVLAFLTFLGLNYAIGEHSPALMQWGWRLPFLFSAVLIGLGLYVRLKLDETPVFAEEKARDIVPKAPLSEVLQLQRREIALATGSFVACFTFPYMASSYLATYAQHRPGLLPQRRLVGRCAGRARERDVHRTVGHSVRPIRTPPDDVGRLGSLPTLVVCGDPADGNRQPPLLRGGYCRHQDRRVDCLWAYGSIHPRTVCHPLPLQRNSAGRKRRRRRWRRRATAHRRHTAGNLRRLGDRRHAGHRCRGQPALHLLAARNHRDSTSIVEMRMTQP